MLLTLLSSLGVLVMLGDGSHKKMIAAAAIIACIGFLFGSGVVGKFLDSFSSTGDLGGSSVKNRCASVLLEQIRVKSYFCKWLCR